MSYKQLSKSQLKAINRTRWREVSTPVLVGPNYALRLELITGEQYATYREAGRHAIQLQFNDGSIQFILLPENKSCPS